MKHLSVFILLTVWLQIGCDSQGSDPNTTSFGNVSYVHIDSIKSDGEHDFYALSADGSTVLHYTEPVSLSKFGTIFIWDARTGARKNTIVVDPMKYRITRLELSDDGSLILGTMYGYRKIVVWDVSGSLLGVRNGFVDGHFIGGGSAIAGLAEDSITKARSLEVLPLDLTSEQTINYPLMPTAYFYGVDHTKFGLVFIPDGTMDTIVVWDAQTNKVSRSFEAGQSVNYRLYFSNDHRIIAGGNPTTFWNLENGGKITELQNPPLKWRDFAHDRAFSRTTFVNVNDDTVNTYHQYITIHDLVTTNQLFADSSRLGGIYWSQYSADEKQLAIGTRSFIKILRFN